MKFNWFSKARFAVVAAVALGVGIASAATVVSSASSAEFRFDTREGARESTGTETLAYSALWSGDSNSVVTISQACATPHVANGPVVDGLALEGEQVWTATYDGEYTLTHATVTGGVTGKVETATFVVRGLGYPPVQAEVAGFAGAYDGEGHGVTVAVSDPADGALVRYSVGDAPGEWSDVAPLFTNVCNATVWVEISAASYTPETNSVVVKIDKATYDMSSTKWDYAGAFTYDGKEKTVALTGLPDGVAVTYTGNAATTAGVYTAHATLVYDEENYEAISVADLKWEVVASKPKPGPGPGPAPGPEPGPEPEPGPKKSRVLWQTDTPFVPHAVTTWNGYVFGDNSTVAGVIQARVGRPNRRTSESMVSVSVRLVGQRKQTLRLRQVVNGVIEATMPDGKALKLSLGAESLGGTLGGFGLDGSRNVFKAKDAASKARASQALKLWRGIFVATWPGASGWNGLSVKVGARGRVRVIGRTATGARFNMHAQFLLGERDCAVAVFWAGRGGASMSSILWFCEKGTVECENNPAAAVEQMSAAGSGFAPGATLHVAADDITPINPKFFCTKKTGVFRGHFYLDSQTGKYNRRLQVPVCGVVVDGEGYGTAVIKGRGPVPVTIK